MREAKQAIRIEVRRRLGELTEADIAAASSAIANHMRGLAAWESAGVVMGFVSLPDEVQTRELLADVLSAGRRLCLPRVDWQGRQMAPVAVASLDGLTPGRFGLLEPAADAPAVDVAALDLVLVPGLAFDAAGHRLGRGGGFYDRLLADPDLRATTVAVAFDCQLRDDLPREDHDLPVDVLVTESGVRRCKRV